MCVCVRSFGVLDGLRVCLIVCVYVCVLFVFDDACVLCACEFACLLCICVLVRLLCCLFDFLMDHVRKCGCSRVVCSFVCVGVCA